MHTSSKLNATPRERLVELEQRFPFLELATRPKFYLFIAAALFAMTMAYVAWTAGHAIQDLWQGYTTWISDSAEPPTGW